MKRAIDDIEKERRGREKHYAVYCNELGWKDSFILIVCITAGCFFLILPLIQAYLSSWDAVDPVLVILIYGLFNGMLAYFMPALGFIEYREKTSKILVVTDQGFEVWKPKRRRTELAYTARWNEVTDIWVDPRQGSYVKSTRIFLFTKDGDIPLETKWPNVYAFLKDLAAHNSGVIQRAEGYTRECIDYSLNDPDSAARKGALKG